MFGGWHGHGITFTTVPPPRQRSGGQSNAGNICTGVMPSPPRIIAGASKLIHTSVILSKTKTKLKPSLSSSCCTLGWGSRLEKLTNGEHGLGL